MATEVLKQEADNDGFVTDETEVTVVGDGDDDLGAHLVQPDEDNGRRRILRGQKKLVTVAGVEQHDDAPPTQAPAYETPRVKTLRRGRTRLVKSGARPPPKPRGRGRRKSTVLRASKTTSPTGDRQGSVPNFGGAGTGYNPPPFDPWWLRYGFSSQQEFEQQYCTRGAAQPYERGPLGGVKYSMSEWAELSEQMRRCMERGEARNTGRSREPSPITAPQQASLRPPLITMTSSPAGVGVVHSDPTPPLVSEAGRSDASRPTSAAPTSTTASRTGDPPILRGERSKRKQKKKKTRQVLVATTSSSSASDLDDSLASVSVVSTRSSTSRPRRGKQPNLSFNGDEYQVFRQLFLTAAENQGWDDKEKFQTLLNALKGPAKSVMTLIDRSTATYKVLLRVLDEMYGV